MHRTGYNQNEIQSASHQLPPNTSSVADELTKLAKLREQGIITEEEFTKLKKDLLDGKSTV